MSQPDLSGLRAVARSRRSARPVSLRQCAVRLAAARDQARERRAQRALQDHERDGGVRRVAATRATRPRTIEQPVLINGAAQPARQTVHRGPRATCLAIAVPDVQRRCGHARLGPRPTRCCRRQQSVLPDGVRRGERSRRSAAGAAVPLVSRPGLRKDAGHLAGLALRDRSAGRCARLGLRRRLPLQQGQDRAEPATGGWALTEQYLNLVNTGVINPFGPTASQAALDAAQAATYNGVLTSSRSRSRASTARPRASC